MPSNRPHHTGPRPSRGPGLPVLPDKPIAGTSAIRQNRVAPQGGGTWFEFRKTMPAPIKTPLFFEPNVIGNSTIHIAQRDSERQRF